VQGGAECGPILVKPTAEGFIEHNKALGRFLICNFSFHRYTRYIITGKKMKPSVSKNEMPIGGRVTFFKIILYVYCVLWQVSNNLLLPTP
jgi:hypothetical protein